MTRFIPNAKQSAAAHKLHNAYIYLLGQRNVNRSTFDLLMEAERFVRCGFKMPNWITWMPWEQVKQSVKGDA